MSLIIKQFEIGPLNNFLYLLGDEETKEMAIVDPAWQPELLMNAAEELGYTITKVFLTHGHPDHVNGLPDVLAKYNVPVYLSEAEPDFLTPDCDDHLVRVAKNEQVTLGNITFDTLLCPGHTPGCQCFLYDGHLIAGDVIFIDGCGRCDLKGGDPAAMYDSLRNVIMTLPDETIIYCGHNYGPTPTDTIGHQKQTNPYLQPQTKEEFLYQRM